MLWGCEDGLGIRVQGEGGTRVEWVEEVVFSPGGVWSARQLGLGAHAVDRTQDCGFKKCSK